MKRAALAAALVVGLCAGATAAPAFMTDFAKAKQEAKATGKLIFVYFNLPG
jgi:hypothetical protein